MNSFFSRVLSALKRKKPSRPAPEQGDGRSAPPCAPFKVGDRIRAKRTRYPARVGAIGRVLEVKTSPMDGAIVEWEKPQENYSPMVVSTIWPWDYEYYETLAGKSE